MELVTLDGTESLTEEERAIANNLINKKFEKIKKHIRSEPYLRTVFKKYGKAEEKKKNSVRISIKASNHSFKSEESGWDFVKTLNKALNKIQSEIEHKFHLN